MPALIRPTLCPKHAKGSGLRDEPDGVRPPEGSSACTICKQETAQRVALRESGTRTLTHLVSALDADQQYAPQSRRAAMLLASRREREERERLAADDAVAQLDADRPNVIAYDHARAGRERQDLYRRQHRLPRLKRPRF
jgi:hypothetical protein